MVFKRVQFAASATAASATFELEIAQLAATMEELKAGRKPSAVAVVRGDMQKLRILYGRAVGTIARGFAALLRRRSERSLEALQQAAAIRSQKRQARRIKQRALVARWQVLVRGAAAAARREVWREAVALADAKRVAAAAVLALPQHLQAAISAVEARICGGGKREDPSLIISQGWMEAQIKKDERAKMLKTRMLRKAKLTTNANLAPNSLRDPLAAATFTRSASTRASMETQLDPIDTAAAAALAQAAEDGRLNAEVLRRNKEFLTEQSVDVTTVCKGSALPTWLTESNLEMRARVVRRSWQPWTLSAWKRL